MWSPNPMPPGLWFAYVFQARKNKNAFKVGITQSPEERRRSVGSRNYKYDSVVEWQLESFFSALCIEQALVNLLKQCEFTQIGDDDLFEVDEKAMAVVIEMGSDLAKKIKDWERANGGASCTPMVGTPFFENSRRVKRRLSPTVVPP